MSVTLPDFDDIANLIEEISNIALEKNSLDIEIKLLEAGVVMQVMGSPEFQINGKPPAMNFVESTLQRTGINGELIPKRKRLAVLTAMLDKKRLQYDLMKARIEVWRSEQANQRTGTL